ncbi:MAG TPA: DUF6785 family protein [Chthonomonadaceae bacterium]|nr:DUF6785 family protein [Chthonomonadaceae bacterium]
MAASPLETGTETKAPQTARGWESVGAGLTARSLLIAVLLTILAGLWVRQSEIVTLATQVTESIPAIPGLAALVLVVAVNAVLRRIRGVKAFTRAEILVIFLFVTLSSTMMGVGVMQFLFALMGTPFYMDQDTLAKLHPLLPRALMPHDLVAIKHLYERSPDGSVPWHLWWGPMLLWLGFFLALWGTLYCMMALFYRAWAEEERLSFPQVFIPLEMTGGESGVTPFFRNKLMWSGFALAAVYNLINIAHALNPSIPAIGKEIDFFPTAPAPPWSELAPLKFAIRPEMIGLGYLVSTEISLTVWVSYFAQKLVAVMGVSMGVTPGTLPYAQEQGIGAYLTLAVMLIWLSRLYLRRIWRQAWSGREEIGPEGIRYRWAFCGLAVGFLAVWSFMTLAGMAHWVALIYLLLVLAVALVYGRLRAEAGVPLVWLFPYYMQKKVLLYTFGTHPFQAASPTTMPTWALFTFLARGYYPAVTGYQVESMELTRRAQINPRRVLFAICLAIALGFLVGWFNHIVPYYQRGAQNLRGIWGEWIAEPEYDQAVSAISTNTPPQEPKIYATVIGAFVVFALWTLRLRFAGFLLHPMGYVMTCSYGSLIWGPFLVVWLLKSLALRYGGMKFYRTTVPFFLGLALGHFAIAGILWGLTGAWTGSAVQGYPVFFG